MTGLIRRYTVVNASMAAMFGLTMPILYLALLDKGLSLVGLGTVMAAFTASAMVFEVPFGALADVIGRKRTFLLGEMVMLFSTVGLWLGDSVAALALAMVFNGMARALLSGSLDALMVEQLRESHPDGQFDSARLLHAQAKVGGTSAICLGLAAILGSVLPLAWGHVQLGSRWIGYYEINFAVMVPLIVAHLWLTCRLIRETPSSGSTVGSYLRKALAPASESVALLRRAPLVLALMALQWTAGGALAMVEGFWQPRLGQMLDARGDIWLFGILCSISFIAMGMGQKLAVRLARAFDARYIRLLLFLQVVSSATLAALAWQQHPAGFFACYILLYLLIGAMTTPTTTILHEQADDRMRSTLLSTKAFFQQCGALAGVLVGARVAAAYGIGCAWALMAAALLLGSLCLVRAAWREGAHPPVATDQATA